MSVKETLFQAGLEVDEEPKLTQKVQRSTGRKSKQEQLRRLHRAQVIQAEARQLLQGGAGAEPG